MTYTKNERQKITKFIGRKLEKLRITHAFNATKIAEILGVTHQQIRKYEKGEDRICSSRLILLAKFFKVDLNEFIETKDPTIILDDNNKYSLAIAKKMASTDDIDFKKYIYNLINTHSQFKTDFTTINLGKNININNERISNKLMLLQICDNHNYKTMLLNFLILEDCLNISTEMEDSLSFKFIKKIIQPYFVILNNNIDDLKLEDFTSNDFSTLSELDQKAYLWKLKNILEYKKTYFITYQNLMN